MSGVVPAKIAAGFTMGELAVLTVIARECQRAGACTLCVDAIAALAGCSRTAVKRAQRKGQQQGLIVVKERPVPGQKNLTNVITIVSRDWAAWLRLGAKASDDRADELRRMKYRDYLQTEAWREKKDEALRQADHKCRVCNRSNRLNVHHRTYARRGQEDSSDLIVLCTACHILFHENGRLFEEAKQET